MRTNHAKPATVGEYLARLKPPQRKTLEQLRRTIRKTASEAEECISYQLCAFRQNGMLAGFGATARHCAFYLMSAARVAARAEDLAGCDTSKGTICFEPEKPPSAALIRKLIKARLAENESLKTA